jgi:hypothetical protein
LAVIHGADAVAGLFAKFDAALAALKAALKRERGQ